MTTDTITIGSTYLVTATILDPDGVVIPITSGWQAACTVCAVKIGGLVAATIPMVIANGSVSGKLDTDSTLVTGRYYYDVRVTDPAGVDYWTDAICLNLITHSTPPA